jgi:hypothetical protein
MVTMMQRSPQTLVPLTEVSQHRPWAKERLLRRYVAEHRVPFYKVDGRILFDLADLDAHVEAGRVEARA